MGHAHAGMGKVSFLKHTDKSRPSSDASFYLFHNQKVEHLGLTSKPDIRIEVSEAQEGNALTNSTYLSQICMLY